MSNIIIAERLYTETDSEVARDTVDTEKDTSSTTTRTRAREEIAHDEQQIDRLMHYAKDGGLPDTPAMRAYNRRLMDGGMSIRVMMAVMDETMMAPRPTWHYYAAIMRRLESQGVKMWYQWEQRQARFRAFKDS